MRKVRKYNCTVCGLPKAGHVCRGMQESKQALTMPTLQIEERPEQIEESSISVARVLHSDTPQIAPVAAIPLTPTMYRLFNTKSIEMAYKQLILEISNQYKAQFAASQKECPAQIETYVEYHDSASNTWQKIIDSNVIQLLIDLYDNPPPGKPITYSCNNHNYTCTKDSTGIMMQTNTQYLTTREVRVRRHASGKRKSTDKDTWKKETYFNKWPVKLDTDFYMELLTNHNFGLTPAHIKGDVARPSAELAALAELWDSIGLGTCFDPIRTEIWENPGEFSGFIRMAMDRGLHTMKLVAHGSTDKVYDAMRKDSRVFNKSVLTADRAGIGIYASASPHIAFDYRDWRSSMSRNKDRTILLGLLLEAKPQTNLQTKNGHTIYTNYHLGASNFDDKKYNDAYCVHDADMVFWLGLCVSR